MLRSLSYWFSPTSSSFSAPGMVAAITSGFIKPSQTLSGGDSNVYSPAIFID